jgi:uncharacterized protein
MSDTKDIERDVAHRPWPLPTDSWLMFQSWRDQLFMHWPVSASMLRALVPEPLAIDTHQGVGWVGITPFRVDGLRARLLPPLPGLSSFPELNLRTYVRYGERPGVWFFSLDTPNQVAVLAARVGYNLPYHTAQATLEPQGDGWFRYVSERDDAHFNVRYRGTGHVYHAEPGSLDHFLTERYALFVVGDDGVVSRGDIHHRPWALQDAEAEIGVNTLAAAHGIELPPQGPKLHFAARQDTLVWPLRGG